MKLLLRFSYVDRKLRDFEHIADVKNNDVLKLGRVKEGNDVVLKSTSVSRQHATIRLRNGVLQVRDSGSFNGTFLEKTKLSKNDGYVQVEQDQIVRFGSLNMNWSILNTALPPSTSAPTPPKKESNRPKKKRRMSTSNEEEDLEIFRPKACECDVDDVDYVEMSSYTLFGTGGHPTNQDLTQGVLNNCYFVAGLGAVAEFFPDAIRAAMKHVKDRTYDITFQVPRRSVRGHSVATSGVRTVRVDDSIFVKKSRRSSRRKSEDEEQSLSPPYYMRSATHSLWPLIFEKAWISFLGGTSYDDICDASGKTSGSGTSRLRGFPLHAGFVVQSLTGIMYSMHQLSTRSDDAIFKDLENVHENMIPAFVGTFKASQKSKKMYADLKRSDNIALFANHNYAVIGWRVHEDDGKRYFRIRNPHNRTRLSKSKTMTLPLPCKIHRMSTRAKLKPLEHGQEFECTIEQLRKYFMTYEVSKRGGTSLRDRSKTMVKFAGRDWDEVDE